MSSYKALLAIFAVASAACSDTELPDAIFPNIVDTLNISSLEGTPVSEPSAYSIPDRRLVRTDISASFDFAYLFNGNDHMLIPLDGLGIGGRSSNPGIQKSSLDFDLIADPPADGYQTTDSLAIEIGDVIIARSRIACIFGVPQYAKLEILSFDESARVMNFRVVSNTNCGYRSLAPGLPTT